MRMRRPVPIYLLLAFGISWSIAAVAWSAGVEYGGGPATVAVGGAFMLGPAIAAFIVRRKVDRGDLAGLGLTLRGIRWKWMGITVLLGMAIPAFNTLICWLFGDGLGIDGFGHTSVSRSMFLDQVTRLASEQGLDPDTIGGQLDRLRDLPLPGVAVYGLVLISALIAALTVNIPFMFGEEFGWRGYLLHHTRHLGLWRHVLLTGIVWGLWHAPLILQGHNYPAHPVAGVFLMVVFTLLLSVPFAWVRVRARCIWAPCVLHGLVNGTAGIGLYFTEGGDPLLASPVGLSGMLAVALTGLLLLVADPTFAKDLRATSPDHSPSADPAGGM